MAIRIPTLKDCAFLFSITILLLFTGTVVLKLPITILLIGAAVIAGIKTWRLGHTWSEIEAGIVKGVAGTLPAVMILLMVGTLSGSWIASGTIPALIYYGLELISPQWYLIATFMICSIVGVSIGSSWTTAATVGIALVGIGVALGINPALCAGSVISGAYFGDKLSPLSDTTNLAPGVAGTDLFLHIRTMLITTIPAWIITMGIFVYFGYGVIREGSFDPVQVDVLQKAIGSSFSITPFVLIPLLVVIILAAMKFPAVVILIAGWIAGILCAVSLQGAGIIDTLQASYSGFSIHSGNEVLDKLLNRGGILSFMETILIILCATGLSGIWESGGFIRSLHDNLLQRIRSEKGLVITTVITAMLSNVLMAEQYLSIVVTGRIYRDAFENKRLAPRMLSRSLEDGGTVTSPLVPWNSCGAFMSAALGVPTIAYLPYAFFNLIMPVVAITFTLLGLFIIRDETFSKIQADAFAGDFPRE